MAVLQPHFFPWASRQEARIWGMGAACLVMTTMVFLGFALYAQSDWRRDLDENRPTAAFLLAEMNRYLSAVGYRSPVVAREGRLAFFAGVPLFRIGEASVDPRHQQAVRSLAASFAFIANCYLDASPAGEARHQSDRSSPIACRPQVSRLSALHVIIEGHADAKPIRLGAKGYADNRSLSAARATVIQQLLVKDPFLSSYPITWGSAGFGDKKVRFKPGENPRNRRIELMLSLSAE